MSHHILYSCIYQDYIHVLILMFICIIVCCLLFLYFPQFFIQAVLFNKGASDIFIPNSTATTSFSILPEMSQNFLSLTPLPPTQQTHFYLFKQFNCYNLGNVFMMVLALMALILIKSYFYQQYIFSFSPLILVEIQRDNLLEESHA